MTMKWFFVIFLFFSARLTAQLNELFDAGFITNGWDGSVDKFESLNGRLHLNANAESSEAWLFHSSRSIIQTEWLLDVEMQFDPSSQNFCRYYLTADKANPSEIKNGYYINIGASDDDISLYRMVNGLSVKLIDGENGRLTKSVVKLSIRVTVDNIGKYKLEVNTDLDWISEGESMGDFAYDSQFAGVYCKYTSTRSKLFYFDNLKINGECYNVPLKLIKSEIETNKRVVTFFSESLKESNLSKITLFDNNGLKIDGAWITTDNQLLFTPTNNLPSDFSGTIYFEGLTSLLDAILPDTSVFVTYSQLRVLTTKMLNSSCLQIIFNKNVHSSIAEFLVDQPSGEMINAVWTTNQILNLNFDNPLHNRSAYCIKMSNVSTFLGDIVLDSQVKGIYFIPERYDVVINEFITDPSPSMGLPEYEFIELYNVSDFEIDLSGWQLGVKNIKYSILSGRISPHSLAVITSEKAVLLFPRDINVIGLKTFPSLTKTGGEITIYSELGTVIDVIKYKDSWGLRSFKDDGGWSFEQIDAMNRSGSSSNWAYSLDLYGGTPGKPNSVKAINPDVTPPRVTYLEMLSDNELTVNFSEGIVIDNNLKSLIPNELSVLSVIVLNERNTAVRYAFNESIEKGRQYFLKSQNNITDYAGNKLITGDVAFGKIEDTEAGDVIINEVLFNPISDDVDFIEILNRSQKTLSLKSIFVGRMVNNTPLKLIPLTYFNIPMVSGSIWVLSIDTAITKTNHPKALIERLLEVPEMPSMPDDKGDIAILSSNGQVLDRLAYDENWHFSLLNTTEGISLERIHTLGQTQADYNWLSASSSTGYSTPTLLNSQSRSFLPSEKEVFSIYPDLFIPNGDGIDDVTAIDVSTTQPGGVISLIVYNSIGKVMKTIANNQLVGTIASYTWDGTNNSGVIVPPGIYVMNCSIFYKNGITQSQKKSCIVGYTNK